MIGSHVTYLDKTWTVFGVVSEGDKILLLELVDDDGNTIKLRKEQIKHVTWINYIG